MKILKKTNIPKMYKSKQVQDLHHSIHKPFWHIYLDRDKTLVIDPSRLFFR